jgi:hypothetical protein
MWKTVCKPDHEWKLNGMNPHKWKQNRGSGSGEPWRPARRTMRGMNTSFRLLPLDPAAFQPLFALDDGELQRRGIRRCIADRAPGFPCRVSLTDSQPGDELLLLAFEHLPVNSPYRASGPIYVRRGAQPAQLAPGEVPAYVTSRLMSLRAYDDGDMMVDGAVVDGPEVAANLQRMFADPAVRYVQLHNAKRGCYSCRAERV